MADSTAAVAKKYPNTKFAIVDVSAPFMKGKPKNVRGITFAEQEAGCLAGVAAASVTKTNTIASVGGLKIPPVDAVHRRVPVLREEGQAVDRDAE